jgi:hypothetical protein
MTAIDWSILRGTPDAGIAVQQGFDRGAALGRRRVAEQALGALARDPANVDALANLTAVDAPEAYQFQQARRAQADFTRGENFRSALGGYLNGGGAPQPNALALPPTAPALPLHGVVQPGRDVPTGASPPPGHGVAQQPVVGTLDALAANMGDDIVVQGRRPVPMAPAPRAPGGNGWDRVVAADPVAAMKAGHEVFGSREDHLKDWQHVSAAAMKLMGNIQDQEGWDRGKETARHLYDAYGVPFPDNLPDEYSPEVVRDLQMQQLDIEDQIAAALRERKFDWQQKDDLLDNARADRNTDSTIADRTARRGLTVRGQNMTDARGRQATAVASADRRRGQDLQGSRPRGAGGGSRAASAKPVTQAEYARLPSGASYVAPDGSQRVKP